jgi:hypothetical protein
VFPNISASLQEPRLICPGAPKRTCEKPFSQTTFVKSDPANNQKLRTLEKNFARWRRHSKSAFSGVDAIKAKI